MIKTKYPLFCFCLVVCLFVFLAKFHLQSDYRLRGRLQKIEPCDCNKKTKAMDPILILYDIGCFIPKHWLKQYSVHAIPVRFLYYFWLIFFLIVVALHVENFSLDYGNYFALVVIYWYLLLPVRSVKRHQRHVLRIGQWHALVGSSASISER